MQKFWKSVKIWQSYREFKGGPFLRHSVYLIERELLPIEVLHCGNMNFRHFWLLWPWPWPDNLHIRTQPVDLGDMLHVQIRTSYVKAFESYRLTDIHADRQTRRKLITHAALRVVINKSTHTRGRPPSSVGGCQWRTALDILTSVTWSGPTGQDGTPGRHINT